TAADKLDAYAADLARKVRLAFPTRVVTHSLESGTLRFGDRHAKQEAAAAAFLQQAEPLGFQLGRTPINAFIRDHHDKLFAGNAQQVQSVILHVWGLANHLSTTPAAHGTSPPTPPNGEPTPRDMARQNLLRQYPSLEQLLGSTDFCACQECRSVLSPAAYLTD